MTGDFAAGGVACWEIRFLRSVWFLSLVTRLAPGEPTTSSGRWRRRRRRRRREGIMSVYLYAVLIDIDGMVYYYVDHSNALAAESQGVAYMGKAAAMVSPVRNHSRMSRRWMNRRRSKIRLGKESTQKGMGCIHVGRMNAHGIPLSVCRLLLVTME